MIPFHSRTLHRLGALLALLMIALPVTAWAVWPTDPAVNQPVSTEILDQLFPLAVSDNHGGMIVVWEDIRSNARDIYAQRYDAKGIPLWTPGGLPVCTAPGQQWNPVVIGDDAGGAYFAWEDTRGADTDIYVQQVHPAGFIQFAANGVPLCSAVGNQIYPVIVPSATGSAIVTWMDYRAGGTADLYAQRVSNAGQGQMMWTPNGVLVCGASGNQAEPKIISDGATGAIVTWSDFRSGTEYRQFAQRINVSGVPQWQADGVPLHLSTANATSASTVPDGAGGAIVAWQDSRSDLSDIYAQRIGANGALLWTASGVPLGVATASQLRANLVTDGAGGAIATWMDTRSGGLDIYAGHITGNGTVSWGQGGVGVCTEPSEQNFSSQNRLQWNAVADGFGGAIVVWQDKRGGPLTDLYAQRVGPTGTMLWTSNGVTIATAAGNQINPGIAPDGLGGAIMVWQDYRSGGSDVYSQQVRANGKIGSTPEPVVLEVGDVPYDQGGAVQVEWVASNADVAPLFDIASYSVWRRVPDAPSMSAGLAANEGALSGKRVIRTAGTAGQALYWEFMDFVPARGFPGYSFVASTTSDSLGVANPYTSFMVMAEHKNGSTFYASAADSGYSVDNLSPEGPGPFQGQYMAGGIHLHWSPNKEADLAGYRLYEGTSGNFTPGPGNLLSATTDTLYVHESLPGSYYKLTAVDVHGNESDPSLLTPAQVTTVEGSPLPAAVRFSAPAPNPSQGMVAFRVDLTKASLVGLDVFDVHGRLVQSAGASVLHSGHHELRWDGRSTRGEACGTGVYFARLVVNGRPAGTRSVTIVR